MEPLKAIGGAIASLLLIALGIAIYLSAGRSHDNGRPDATGQAQDDRVPRSAGTHPALPAGATPASETGGDSRVAIPGPAPTPAPPRRVLEHSTYVASGDAEAYTFTVSRSATFKLLVEIENDVPLDIAATDGPLTRMQWLLAAAVAELALPLEIVVDTQTPDPFANPFSKRAAFRRFESDWAILAPGTYTVIIDNSDGYTPSRGDAVLRLSLYEAP